MEDMQDNIVSALTGAGWVEVPHPLIADWTMRTNPRYPGFGLEVHGNFVHVCNGSGKVLHAHVADEDGHIPPMLAKIHGYMTSTYGGDIERDAIAARVNATRIGGLP